MPQPKRPTEAAPTAKYDPKTRLSVQGDPKSDQTCWTNDGNVLLALHRNKSGRLHGEVYWNLSIKDAEEYEPRVALHQGLGLPSGPVNQFRARYEDGALAEVHFRFFDVRPEDYLFVTLEDDKVRRLEWKVGTGDDVVFEYGDFKLEKKALKVPKPWPAKLVATFDAKGKATTLSYFDEKGRPVAGAAGPLSEWGEKTKRKDIAGYIERGAFLEDATRFFAGAQRAEPEDLPKKTTKLANLPAAHRGSADVLDRLVRKKQLPLMTVTFDLDGYGFDCAKEQLEGASDPKYLGIANDGAGDMYLLDTKTGQVFVYSHEEGTLERDAFPSLDAFAFAMLRIEAAAQKRIPKPALKKLFAGLELKAALSTLARF